MPVLCALVLLSLDGTPARQAREMNRTGKLGKLLKILAQASLLVRRTTIRVELLQ